MDQTTTGIARTCRRLLRAGPLLAVAALAGLLATGCGGGSDETEGGAPPPAAAGSTATGGDSDRAVRYAECMRENGVPNFPDPENGRIVMRAGPGSGLNPNSPEFKAAREACQPLAPEGVGGGAPDPQMQARVLEFARCMRENGVPEFPDPKVSGGTVTMGLGGGVDPNDPGFQAAQQTCSEILAQTGGAP